MSEMLDEAAARAHGIVVFERRLITKAQPPISEETLAKIQSRCIGLIPDGLKDLWRRCFGGAVDYDLSIELDGQVHSFSFTELILNAN